MEAINTRWLKQSLQPRVRLRNESPFTSKLLLRQDQVPDGMELSKDVPTQFDGGAQPDSGDEEDPLGRRLDPSDLVDHRADFDEQCAYFRIGEEGSDAESGDVVVLDGGSGGIPLKISPSERRNEVSNYVYHLLQRIGYGPTSIKTMDSLEQCIVDWETKHLENSSGFGLSASIKTVGRPAEHALKKGHQKPRSNGVKSKRSYRCGWCHHIGHNAGSKCPLMCLKCSGTKKHKKGDCPKAGNKRGKLDLADCGDVDGKVFR